LTECA